MNMLVVLFALLAVASAKPSSYAGLLYPSAVSHQSRVDIKSTPFVSAVPALHTAYVAQAPAVVAAPSAVSHQSRVDVISSPVVSAPVAYSAPVYDAVEVAAAPDIEVAASPIVEYAPAPAIEVPVAKTILAAPTAVSHQSRVDIHKSAVVAAPLISTYAAAPAVSTYAAAPAVSAYAAAPAVSAYAAAPAVSTYAAAPVVSTYAAAPVVSTYAAAPVVSAYTAPLALGPHTPATVLHANGVPLDTAEVVAAKAAHFQAKALVAHGIHKRSVITPVAYSAVVAPSAVSHQSRVDIHSKPVIAAPIVAAYSAPIVKTYSTPIVNTYSAPILSNPLVSAYHAPLVSAYAAPAYSIHPY